VLTVNLSTYVELPIFHTSEWLVTFSFVTSFYFLFSFEESEKNCNTEMMQSAATLNAMLVKN
jgi:hypothetical protein